MNEKTAMNEILKYLSFIMGIIFSIYGLLVISLIGRSRLFNFFYLTAGLFLLLFSLIQDQLNKKMVDMINLFLIGTSAIFIIIEILIISYAHKKTADDARYLIILGSQVRATGPSMDYQARLDAAYEYLLNEPKTIVITTGGKGKSEPLSEGQGGADYLLKKGISSKRIIVEDQSTSTLENLQFARKLIEKDGGDVAKDKIVIVSADYHLYRASYIAEKLAYRYVSCKGGRGLFILQPHYYTREAFALIKEMLTLH